MFQPQFFFEAGKARSGTALIPFFDSTSVAFGISTRNGNMVVDWGDGSSSNIAPVKLKDYADGSALSSYFYKTYSSALNGNVSVKFLRGLKDVYSVYLGVFHDTNQKSKLNILDVETFFHQFPNLFSLCIDEYAYQTTARMSVIKGDLAKLPNSVERVRIISAEILNAATYFTLNFSSYTNFSNLKYFGYVEQYNQPQSTIKISGDLGKLPTSCQLFYLQKASAGSAITYTAGKVWASSFDTLYLPIPLTPTENDNLLIDANNYITTAIGSKIFNLLFLRTSVSDVAVAGLIAKGFTVNCTRISDTMLTIPLSANLLDSSSYSNNATMVGTETHSLGGLQTSTGNYAYIPNKTSLDFGTGSLRFGCTVKFNSIVGGMGLIGKTMDSVSKGRYGIYMAGSKIEIYTDLTSGFHTNTTSVTPYNDGGFHKIEVICNRTTGKQTLIIDNVLIATTSFTPSSDNLTRNARFWIGGYGNSAGTGLLAGTELNGIVKDVFVNKF